MRGNGSPPHCRVAAAGKPATQRWTLDVSADRLVTGQHFRPFHIAS